VPPVVKLQYVSSKSIISPLPYALYLRETASAVVKLVAVEGTSNT